MTRRTYVFGYDYGNAEATGVLIDPETGSERACSMSSALSLGSLEDLASKLSGFGKQGSEHLASCLAADEHVLSFRGEEHFLGDLALRQGRSPETGRGDIGRYQSVQSLQFALALSGLLIGEREYQLAVVTGLPVESFSSGLRQQVKTMLEGDHPFIFNGVERKASITVLSTIMEGAGALIAYGTPDATGVQGVIDIGGHTTDLFAAERQRPLIERCAGKTLGVERAADLLSERFLRSYGRPLKLSERRALLLAHANHDPLPEVVAQGKRVHPSHLSEWREQALTTVGNEIASFVSQVWKSSERGEVASDMTSLALVGGGAYYFYDVLKRRLPQLFRPQKPELANAIGYAALAEAMLSQGRAPSSVLQERRA